MGSHTSPEQIAKRLTPGQRQALLWLPAEAGVWDGPAPSGLARMLASMVHLATPLVQRGKRAGQDRHVPYALTEAGAAVRFHVRQAQFDEVEVRPAAPWYRRVGGMRFFRFGRLQVSVCMLRGSQR